MICIFPLKSYLMEVILLLDVYLLYIDIKHQNIIVPATLKPLCVTWKIVLRKFPLEK